MTQTKNTPATILIVDDVAANISMLLSHLSQHGFKALVARDGESALEQMRHTLPDLVLLDVLMPGLDGFEVCRRIKADGKTQKIPIIFMTALNDVVDKVKGFSAGAVDYVTKPFQQEELLARIRTHLTIQQLEKDLHEKNEVLQKSLARERKLLEDLRLNISYAIPHELRTPLATIIGFAEILQDALGQTDPGQAQMAAAIYKSGFRLHHLVENYQLYATLSLMKYIPEFGVIGSAVTTVDVMELTTAVATKKAREWKRSGDLNLALIDASIQVSAANLQKIVEEVIDNAFKFSEPGSPVHLKSSFQDSCFVLSISNQGRGMTSEQLTSIGAYIQFERRRYEQQGSGLGLIIAQLLAVYEGGQLIIESALDAGATVQLILPQK